MDFKTFARIIPANSKYFKCEGIIFDSGLGWIFDVFSENWKRPFLGSKSSLVIIE